MFRKKIPAALILVSAALVFCFFTGCSDDVTAPMISSIDVSGKVTGMFGAPLQNLKISVGGKTVYTDLNGRFTAASVTAPYDIIIVDSVSKHSFCYRKVNSQTLNLQFFPFPPNTSNFVPTNVYVSYPQGIFQSDGKLFFTDGEDVNAYGEALQNGGTILLNLNPQSTLTGKVILLFYTTYGGQVISYDRFGYKDGITVSAGIPVNINFIENDLTLNPPERTVNINLIPVQGYSVLFRFLSLHFGGPQHTINYSIGKTIGDIVSNSFQIVLPEGLPFPYVPVIEASAQNQNLGSTFEKFAYLSGNTLNLQMHNPPQLLSPPDFAQDVDINTVFSFTPKASGELNHITLYDTLNRVRYYIVMEADYFTLKDLSGLGLENFYGRAFAWTCNRRGNYSGIDDFVNPGKFPEMQYMSSPLGRHFTTKP